MEYTLSLLRHGQSVWNLENIFTGWTDVELSPQGIEEARLAGATMRDAGLGIDVVHTSVLRRAIDTTTLALGEMAQALAPERTALRRAAGTEQEGDRRGARCGAGARLAPLLRRATATARPG